MSELDKRAAAVAASSEVESLLRLALAEDLGSGDVTSETMVPAEARGRARIIAREAGVFAGGPIAVRLIELAGVDLRFEAAVAEGEPVESGRIVAEVEGDARALLALERPILNILQRMGGVATTTSRYVAAIAGTSARVLETRKTIPGWRRLDKYAVLAGGGDNHRMGLFDQILAKENHFALCPGETFRARIDHMMRTRPAGIPAEVEVENLAEFEAALASGVEMILLDNMSLDDMRRAVALRDAEGSDCRLEASGGITLGSLRAVAETEVDRISVGALTHSVKAFDLSMLVEL